MRNKIFKDIRKILLHKICELNNLYTANYSIEYNDKNDLGYLSTSEPIFAVEIIDIIEIFNKLKIRFWISYKQDKLTIYFYQI